MTSITKHYDDWIVAWCMKFHKQRVISREYSTRTKDISVGTSKKSAAVVILRACKAAYRFRRVLLGSG